MPPSTPRLESSRLLQAAAKSGSPTLAEPQCARCRATRSAPCPLRPSPAPPVAPGTPSPAPGRCPATLPSMIRPSLPYSRQCRRAVQIAHWGWPNLGTLPTVRVRLPAETCSTPPRPPNPDSTTSSHSVAVAVSFAAAGETIAGTRAESLDVPSWIQLTFMTTMSSRATSGSIRQPNRIVPPFLTRKTPRLT